MECLHRRCEWARILENESISRDLARTLSEHVTRDATIRLSLMGVSL
ncbi:hypothetical protein RRSWK_02452 [Rhodopirellula sp. SWK7]|nr:hypothetical protein RRSWK_02452 [Rhodopirellula sp. SWK7]